MLNSNSKLILNTSSNLLGFCLIVLTVPKISKYSLVSMINEFTGVDRILLAGSSLFPLLSIHTQKQTFNIRALIIPDNIFIVSLLLVFAITFMIAFSINF
jgi:hypothetical protein